MRVYHASMVRVEHSDVFHSRKFLDFVRAFILRLCESKRLSMLNASFAEEKKLGSMFMNWTNSL